MRNSNRFDWKTFELCENSTGPIFTQCGQIISEHKSVPRTTFELQTTLIPRSRGVHCAVVPVISQCYRICFTKFIMALNFGEYIRTRIYQISADCEIHPIYLKSDIMEEIAWRLPGRWPDVGRRSTVARWTRHRAAPAYAPIWPDLTCTVGTENCIRYIRLSDISESDISEFYRI